MATTGHPYDIVALAASAGGITALGKVLGELPAGFGLPVVVVQHLDRRHQTVIADVLGRRAKLPVRLAAEGDWPDPGTIYIAPPDHQNQPFLNLDFGLPTAVVGEIVQECLASRKRTGPVQVAAINRIGRAITCAVACTPLDGTGDAAVLLMEEVIKV